VADRWVTIPRAAELDIDILREMYRGRGVSITGVDPRLNASRIAERLHVSRARVAARLAEWTRSGLLSRYDVWPNPALLGRVGFTLDVHLGDRFRKAETIRRIGLIDGAVGGIDYVGEWLTIQFVVPEGDDPARTAELIRGLAGVTEVAPPIPWARLEPDRPLSPLDLRLIRALREHPRAPLSVIAHSVGISTRTVTTRYGRLVEEQAVWFVPVLDFRALAPPVVSVSVGLDAPAAHEGISRAVRKHYPQSLEFLRVPFGPMLPPTASVFFVIVPSAAVLEELEGFFRGLPGVVSVETLVMIGLFSFPSTFDRLVSAAVGSHRGERPGRAGSAREP
jgi:DNA-binding Lrp family transcriptional regulator